MQALKFDMSKTYGRFKILNATNGGPWHKRHNADQPRSNFAEYKAARIPYSRNHDSNLCTGYGGPYAHDITAIFPNFDADVNDPESYDFACTDESLLVTLEAGTQTFFRLGQSIEHHIKKHGIFPPKDYDKWAQICEHIILHYNEGWADGLHLDIQYWEIWNEPDLYADDDERVSPTWLGTREQFFDLYEVAAKHLKSKFPNLKIGGPAICGDFEWGEQFLREMSRREVPIDFFSWHTYTSTPEKFVTRANIAYKLLHDYGYADAENILNEWNYVRGWNVEHFPYSINAIHGIKNASFILATMALAQPSPIDMLMYYDTRPSAFCGAFDMYSYKPLKGYYPLKWFGNFYDTKAEIRSSTSIDDIYSLCGIKEDGKVICMLTYYSDDDASADKEIAIDFGKVGKYEIYLLDQNNDETLIDTVEDIKLKLSIHSCVLIKEI